MNHVRRLFEKFRRMIFIRTKIAYQLLRPMPKERKVVFIVGCQRSGTTMLSRIFEKDLNAKVYGERSAMTSNDTVDQIRLNDADSVRRALAPVKVPLIVLKPLVESQRTPQLLREFEGSLALWIYRDYKDVALSNRNRFGPNTGIEDIRPIVTGDKDNWRSECVSTEVQTIIEEHFADDMSPYDASVLFWYARNALYFDLHLNEMDNVLICKYEDLVTNPETVCRQIYRELGRPFNRRIVANIHATSVSRGQCIPLSDNIEILAKSLIKRLDLAYSVHTIGAVKDADHDR